MSHPIAVDRARRTSAVPAMLAALTVALLAVAGTGGCGRAARTSPTGSEPAARSTTQPTAHPAARPNTQPTWRPVAEAAIPGVAPVGDADGGDADPAITAGPPTEVRIPRIGVDSTLEMLGLGATGVLNPPTDFAKAGWYANGTAPGEVGPAVIAGHVDSRTGPAVFFRLRELRAGDTVEVARDGRWLTFRVTATHEYPKDRFPNAEVYGPTPDPQLRLITCGGDFDYSRRSYYDNVVIYAVAG